MILTAFQIRNGYAPAQGPRGIRVDLDFSSLTTLSFDMFKEESADVISFVQSVWVENHRNPNPLYFDFLGLGQELKVPANTQGLYPVIAPMPLVFTVETLAVTNEAVKAIFLNIPMPYYQSFSAI